MYREYSNFYIYPCFEQTEQTGRQFCPSCITLYIFVGCCQWCLIESAEGESASENGGRDCTSCRQLAGPCDFRISACVWLLNCCSSGYWAWYCSVWTYSSQILAAQAAFETSGLESWTRLGPQRLVVRPITDRICKCYEGGVKKWFDALLSDAVCWLQFSTWLHRLPGVNQAKFSTWELKWLHDLLLAVQVRTYWLVLLFATRSRSNYLWRCTLSLSESIQHWLFMAWLKIFIFWPQCSTIFVNDWSEDSFNCTFQFVACDGTVAGVCFLLKYL